MLLLLVLTPLGTDLNSGARRWIDLKVITLQPSELAKISGLKEVRGKGLMIGIELDKPVAELRRRLLFEKHIFTGGAGISILRLLPALSIGRKEADCFLKAFKDLINE